MLFLLILVEILGRKSLQAEHNTYNRSLSNETPGNSQQFNSFTSPLSSKKSSAANPGFWIKFGLTAAMISIMILICVIIFFVMHVYNNKSVCFKAHWDALDS